MEESVCHAIGKKGRGSVGRARRRLRLKRKGD